MEIPSKKCTQLSALSPHPASLQGPEKAQQTVCQGEEVDQIDVNSDSVHCCREGTRLGQVVTSFALYILILSVQGSKWTRIQELGLRERGWGWYRKVHLLVNISYSVSSPSPAF